MAQEHTEQVSRVVHRRVVHTRLCMSMQPSCTTVVHEGCRVVCTGAQYQESSPLLCNVYSIQCSSA